jgi:FkbM family methyltransferase
LEEKDDAASEKKGLGLFQPIRLKMGVEGLKCNDLIYDVGMHKGEDTEYYLKKGFRVIGFEANPELVEQCRARFAKELDENRLVIISGAISNEPITEVPFYRNSRNTVWGTMLKVWAERNEYMGSVNEIISVPAVDFSQCLRRYGVPHYMKIDIEGMDAVCLKALLDFNIKPDYVSIESEKISFPRLREEMNLLLRLGYDRFQAVQQSGIGRQNEPLHSREGRFTNHKFEEGSSGLFGGDIPGRWRRIGGIIYLYRFIFLQYRLFGDYGILSHSYYGKKLLKFLIRQFKRPIPGWYDTHARHSSVGRKPIPT